jgi:hypothetical protein
MRSAIGPLSSSRRQTGSEPSARTSSSRPARMSLSTTVLAASPLIFVGSSTPRSSRREAAVPIVNLIRWRGRRIGRCSHPMWDGCRLIWSLLIGLFRSRATVEAENMVLRQQIIVLRRTAPKRLGFNVVDRMILVGLYRLFPDVRSALAIVRPETVVRWHRAGFRAYWRWKSRPRRGRPKVPLKIRQLIREMSLASTMLKSVVGAVRGVAYGVVGTALIQAIAMTIGLRQSRLRNRAAPFQFA